LEVIYLRALESRERFFFFLYICFLYVKNLFVVAHFGFSFLASVIFCALKNNFRLAPLNASAAIGCKKEKDGEERGGERCGREGRAGHFYL